MSANVDVSVSADLAAILAEAAQSEFGIISLMVLVGSIFGMILFRNSNDLIRLIVFLIFAGGLMLGGNEVLKAKRALQDHNTNLEKTQNEQKIAAEKANIAAEEAKRRRAIECEPREKTITTDEIETLSVRERGTGFNAYAACDFAFEKAKQKLQRMCNKQGDDAYIDLPTFYDRGDCSCLQSGCRLRVEADCSYEVEETVMRSPC